MNTCIYCHKKYIPKDPIKAHWKRQKYCSPDCANKGKNGNVHWKLSKESKTRMSIARLGRTLSLETKNKIRQKHLGKKLTEEHKKKIAISRSGKKCNWYKHGLTKDKNYVSWLKNLWSKRRKYANGEHTFDEWNKLKAQYHWTCPCCLKREMEIKLTQDHIVPLSKGGSDNIENIQPLCLSCNIKKHTKTIKY